MTKTFTTLNISQEVNEELKKTAGKVATKLHLSKLSLSDLIDIMHGEYKTNHKL